MFGDELKRRREAAGLSQRELAERSGVHEISISRWETGAQTRPLLDSVAKLARALACRIEDLASDHQAA